MNEKDNQSIEKRKTQTIHFRFVFFFVLFSPLGIYLPICITVTVSGKDRRNIYFHERKKKINRKETQFLFCFNLYDRPKEVWLVSSAKIELS